VDVPFAGRVQAGWVGVVLAGLWIVGLINAYNFMDGIDGLAGGQGLVAGLAWAAFGFVGGQPFLGGVGLLLAGSSAGFLGHNWPLGGSRARIFMGDVGSAFLGYAFAALAVAAIGQAPRMVLAGVLAVWPFVFDTAFTFARRLSRREDVFSAHRSHLYQRLIITGCSHRDVTLLYLALAALGGGLGLAWVVGLAASGPAIVVFLLAASVSLWLAVLWRERRAASRETAEH
jgi:UDP-N-acetylmuramyl pentapeptide phosphotransferase/UDP-N-acetylglucosamine-1-phosphate transferase